MVVVVVVVLMAEIQ